MKVKENGAENFCARNGEKNRSQSAGRLEAESEIRSQEVWNTCAIWLEISYFAQAEGKIRVIFEALLNGFEQFFAKMNEF